MTTGSDEGTALPGTGTVKVSTELLRAWVLLPEGFEIIDAAMGTHDTVWFTVRHNQAAITPDGAEIPTFTPIFEMRRDEDGTRWHRLTKIEVTGK